MAIPQVKVLSDDNLKRIISIILNSHPVIDDEHIQSNSTYSSLNIDKLFKAYLKDSEDYTDTAISSITKLTAEITTTQPTLENSKLNVIYLYSADGNAPYEQYLKISETQLIDLGSTSIDISSKVDVDQGTANAQTILEVDSVTGKLVNTAFESTDIDFETEF